MLAKWPSGITGGRCFFTYSKPQTTTVMLYNLLKTKARDFAQSFILSLLGSVLFWCPFSDFMQDAIKVMYT
jgi:hypothetical protein